MPETNTTSAIFGHDINNVTVKWNCSDTIPTSEDFFNDLIMAEKVMVVICCLVVMTTLMVFGDVVVYVARHYNTSDSQKFKTLQLFSIYPGISLIALFSLCIPKSIILCEQALFIYISAIMYIFVALLWIHTGGIKKMVSLLTESRIRLQSPPCCCCCFCLPTITVTVENVKRLNMLVLQNVIAQPIFAFISLALWIDNKFTLGKIDMKNGFPYILILSQASFLFGLYGVFMIYELCKETLKPLLMGPKFLLIHLIIILTLLQGSIFSIFGKFDMPACRGILSPAVRIRTYFLMVLIFQFLLLSLLARYFYRRPQNVVIEANMDADGVENNDSSIYKLMGKGSEADIEKPLTSESIN